MKLLLKLTILVIGVALLLPVVRPDTPISNMVTAAISDVTGFCDRNPVACAQGKQVVARAGDLISQALRELADREPSSQPLTPADLALTPNAAPPAQQPAIAANNELPRP